MPWIEPVGEEKVPLNGFDQLVVRGGVPGGEGEKNRLKGGKCVVKRGEEGERHSEGW